MRWVLPGGAVLGGNNRGGDERPVACRPRAAVMEQTRPRRVAAGAQTEMILTVLAEPAPDAPPEKPIEPPSTVKQNRTEQLSFVKLVLEVLMVLVGLVGAILALFGLRK